MGTSRSLSNGTYTARRRSADVSVVIPAFREGHVVGHTVAAVKRVRQVDEVVVIDDGSEDDTAAAARDAGARVVRLPRNRGKGVALTAGVGTAWGRVLVFLDADLGATATEAYKLLAPIFADEADVVIGAFPPAPVPSGFGLTQRVAQTALRRLAGIDASSPLSGQRALRRDVLATVQPFASRFGVEVAFTIDAVRSGWRVVEVPVAMQHEKTGRNVSGFIHRGRQLADIVRAVVPRWQTGERG